MQVKIDMGDPIERVMEANSWNYLKKGVLPDGLLPTQELDLLKQALTVRELSYRDTLIDKSFNRVQVGIPFILQVKSIFNNEGGDYEGLIKQAYLSMEGDTSYLQGSTYDRDDDEYQSIQSRKVCDYDIDPSITIGYAVNAIYNKLGYKYTLLFISVLEG